jgi:hypothetical protein
MQAQKSRRLPIFEAIHRKGIAEEKEYKKRLNDDRTYWRDRGKIDHNLDNSQYSDEDTDRGDSDSDSTRKNKSKNKKSKKRWTLKYKRSINCKRPRGFSQRQYCKYGRKKSYKK